MYILLSDIEELAALKTQLKEITEVAQKWVEAVDRDTSWDSWDHYYKQMKYEILK